MTIVFCSCVLVFDEFARKGELEKSGPTNEDFLELDIKLLVYVFDVSI